VEDQEKRQTNTPEKNRRGRRTKTKIGVAAQTTKKYDKEGSVG
jgi:hypothetical protein